MIRTVFVIAAIALGVSIAIAQQDPIAARKALMKANGDQAKIGVAMMKGEAPFDIDKVHKIFAAWEDAAAKMPSLFPAELEDRRRYRRRSEDLDEYGRCQSQVCQARR